MPYSAWQNLYRGELVLTANSLSTQLQSGSHNLPFDEVVYCNIGNPQSLNQAPITFPRQVLSMCINPDLIPLAKANNLFPSDAIERAEHYLANVAGGTGAYR